MNVVAERGKEKAVPSQALGNQTYIQHTLYSLLNSTTHSFDEAFFSSFERTHIRMYAHHLQLLKAPLVPLRACTEYSIYEVIVYAETRVRHRQHAVLWSRTWRRVHGFKRPAALA